MKQTGSGRKPNDRCKILSLSRMGRFGTLNWGLALGADWHRHKEAPSHLAVLSMHGVRERANTPRGASADIIVDAPDCDACTQFTYGWNTTACGCTAGWDKTNNCFLGVCWSLFSTV